MHIWSAFSEAHWPRDCVSLRPVDIEVLAAEKGSANVFLGSSNCYYRRPMRMEEAFCVREALLSAGFDVLSCGKSPIDQNPRASEMYSSLSSWFILGRERAQET